MTESSAPQTHQEQSIKLIVQRNILLVGILLLVGKFAAYFLTNSVGILTDAMESIVNVVSGVIGFYSIRAALKPRDQKHPFGHGKFEFLSASVEGLLISLAGLMIIYEAVKRFFVPGEISQLDTGIMIVAGAGFINYLLGFYSIRVGKKHGSMALVAGGKHLQSDTYSSIGLVVGLILLYVTKLAWIDSVIALIFGSIIIYTGYKILKETTANLMDEADLTMIDDIAKQLWENRSESWIDVHNLKLMKHGTHHYIECDLTLPWYFNVIEAHDQTKRLKKIIVENITSEVDLSIHTDYCNPDLCYLCIMSKCEHRKSPNSENSRWDVERITVIKAKPECKI